MEFGTVGLELRELGKDPTPKIDPEARNHARLLCVGTWARDEMSQAAMTLQICTAGTETVESFSTFFWYRFSTLCIPGLLIH